MFYLRTNIFQHSMSSSNRQPVFQTPSQLDYHQHFFTGSVFIHRLHTTVLLQSPLLVQRFQPTIDRYLAFPCSIRSLRNLSPTSYVTFFQHTFEYFQDLAEFASQHGDSTGKSYINLLINYIQTVSCIARSLRCVQRD